MPAAKLTHLSRLRHPVCPAQDIASALQGLPEGSQADAVRGSVWEGRLNDPEWELDRRLLDKARAVVGRWGRMPNVQLHAP